MSAAPSISISTPTFHVIDQACLDFPTVKKAFDDLILPLYGSQERALRQIGKGDDRLCEVLFMNDQPKGLIVYKKQPTEAAELELKTLCLLEPGKDSGNGYGSMLYQRIKDVARRRGAEKIFVTVSSAKPDSKAFFEKKGFVVTKTEPNKYKEGQTEYSLVADIRPAASVAVAVSNVIKLSSPTPASVKSLLPTPTSAVATAVAAPKPAFAFCTPTATVTASAAATTKEPVIIPRRKQTLKRDRDEDEPSAREHAKDDRPAKAPTIASASASSGAPQAYNYSSGAGRASGSSRDHDVRFQDRSYTEQFQGHRRAYSAPHAHSFGGAYARDRQPMHHECNLKDPYVSFIAQGRKTFEGRVNTQYFKDYQVGDTVTWSSHTTQVTTTITAREFFPTGFDEMLRKVGYQKMLPNVRSHAEALAVYNAIPSYADKVGRFGALAFGLEVLRPHASAKTTEKEAPRHEHYGAGSGGRY